MEVERKGNFEVSMELLCRGNPEVYQIGDNKLIFVEKFNAFYIGESFYWRFSQLYWRFSDFIGEKLNLLAISTYLLAKIKFYWRTGNFGAFFPVHPATSEALRSIA
jgi:hypothetical protein